MALSSLHKDFLCGEFGGSDRDEVGARTMAMISKCHRQLKNYLDRPDAATEVALVCSVIFYTFEALLVDSRRAIWHLDRGLMLLKQS